MSKNAYEAHDSAGRRKYLTAKEGKDFLKAAAELVERERRLCETLYFVGCRVSEAISITRDSIEPGKEPIVRIQCLKKRGKIVIRRVPLPEDLAQALLLLEVAEHGRLWPMSRMRAWRIVKRVMARAAIAGISSSPKGLRHAFGVRAALANTPLHLIQRWMGHASPLTTAIYLDVKGPEEREFIARTWL